MPNPTQMHASSDTLLGSTELEEEAGAGEADPAASARGAFIFAAGGRGNKRPKLLTVVKFFGPDLINNQALQQY